jgi:hypothetical protein
MEKNKLALEIWKLKYEMSLQGIRIILSEDSAKTALIYNLRHVLG